MTYNVYGHSQVYFLTKNVNPPEYLLEQGAIKLNYGDRTLLFKDALSNGVNYFL